MTCVLITKYFTRPSNWESFFSENIGKDGDDQEDTPIDVIDYNLPFFSCAFPLVYVITVYKGDINKS